MVPRHGVAIVGQSDVMLGIRFDKDLFAESHVRCVIHDIANITGVNLRQ